MSLIEDHFKLHRPPFPQATEAAALLHYQSLKDALERLRFAVDRDGIALLTAESGCGKSTALGALARDLDAHVLTRGTRTGSSRIRIEEITAALRERGT